MWINPTIMFKHVPWYDRHIQTLLSVWVNTTNMFKHVPQKNQIVQAWLSVLVNATNSLKNVPQNECLNTCICINTSQMTNDNHNVQTRTSYNLYVQTWVSIWIKISILRHVRECNMISMHIHLHQSEQNVEAFPSIRRASLNIPINKTFIFKHECQWEPCHKHTPIWPAQSRMSVSCRR